MFAQKTISGVVSDAGEPLPGVSIIVKGTSIGGTTDFDGLYSINNLNPKDVLIFSYLGYKTLELTIGNRTTLNVSMENDAQQLDDVVVIGYGSASKSDLTASVTSVSAKDFDKQPLSRAEDALLGRTSGVQVIKNSGAPGADIKVRVRGLNSINGNNDPLLVVDGVIGGNLSSINTNDIKTFDILKDASATAIYGSRAANGVILITTKQGQVGPAKIDVNYFTSISTVPQTLDLVTPQQFADIVNTGISNPDDHISVFGDGVDYQDIYFQSAISNNLQLSASGKTGKTSFFVSGNYIDQEGIVFNSDYKRFSLRSNLKADLTDKLTVGLNLYGSREKSFNLISGGTSSDERGGITSIVTFNPTLPLRDEDGNFTKSSVYGSLLVNPYAVRHERFGDLIDNRFSANLNLSYDFNDNLNFTILGGGSVSGKSSEVYQGIPAGSNDQQSPTASFSSRNFSSYQISNILNWSKEFGEHSVKATGVYEIQELENRNRGFNAADYSIGGIRDGFNFAELAEAQSISADYNSSTLQSYLGRVQYDYNKRLYVTGAIRVDETSRFRKGNRTGGYFLQDL
ncbi:TonB family protein / TonB-dependent receptor [Algibacter lectus]|uniref:TonB family protein / TonB-dependent receptor n=1 Tax=Algibacter lectus TaxID=221126 RepID=A0A090X0K1_9FLAO|nr:SusC/RagA family TonB-linked outer membrane protein [Algibacter lectus]GAL82063.1 TonB family protein / TonB-dependent receptor [Algibacter lectus]